MPAVQVHLLRVQFRRDLAAVDARRHEDYRAIAAAVLAGDPEEAERRGRAHIARLTRHMAEREAASATAAPISSSAGSPS
jgi:DNA-binding FadR family transcriptional regulator